MGYAARACIFRVNTSYNFFPEKATIFPGSAFHEGLDIHVQEGRMQGSRFEKLHIRDDGIF